MRVYHVITRLIVGGAQENTIASVLGLREKKGLEVHLISGPSTGPEGSLEHRVAEPPGLWTLLPELVRPVHPWYDALALRRLTSIFRLKQPDIVHTHSGKAGILGRWAARRAGTPTIIHTIHGPSFGAFQGPAANWTFKIAERLAGRCTAHFIVVANAMRDQYLAAGIGVPEQYTRIFSGFPLEPFLRAKNDPAYRARWGLSSEDIVLGKVARFVSLKGHDDLFEAAPEMARRCPNLKFLLVGDGVLRERFEEQARALGLRDRFVFTGLAPPEEVPRLVGIMDLLVHLSRREGLARCLAQALAAGRPVLAYDCDGAGEVCVDDETGYLISPGDLEVLTDQVSRLAGDPALRARLGERGRKMAGENFPVEKMVTDLEGLYRKLHPA